MKLGLLWTATQTKESQTMHRDAVLRHYRKNAIVDHFEEMREIVRIVQQGIQIVEVVRDIAITIWASCNGEYAGTAAPKIGHTHKKTLWPPESHQPPLKRSLEDGLAQPRDAFQVGFHGFFGLARHAEAAFYFGYDAALFDKGW